MFDVVVKKVVGVVEENKTTILTGIGVAGTITATVLSGRAGMKAQDIIQREQLRRISESIDDYENEDKLTEVEDLTLKEKIWLAGPHFLPAAGTCLLACTATVFSNRLSAKETAAMAAMYGLSDKTFQEYKEKVQEKLGQTKEQGVRDEMAQKRIDDNPPTDRTVIITGNGDVLCYDILTDRYFSSTVEKIRQAQNEINFEITNHDEVSLSRFYEEIGLDVTPYSDSVGWNINNTCEVEIGTAQAKDGRPCITVDFKRWPKADYTKVWP